jgi:hypothetical protein
VLVSVVAVTSSIRHGVSRNGQVSELLVLREQDLEFTTPNILH